VRIPERLAARLHERAQAGRWSLSAADFGRQLEASVERTFGGRSPNAADAERHLSSLNLPDLALAAACAEGIDAAWDHFVREHRPVLYRAADALDPSGGARELADALYAELYGVKPRDGERRSLFRYYSGRSSLATWLRAVLAQRHVDRVRAGRRLEPLPDEEPAALPAASRGDLDPDRARFLALIQRALTLAIAALEPRERLRLSSYYVEQLTLAQVGRLLKEHEATVSRQLDRTRRRLRQSVERYLRDDMRLTEDDISRCFASVVEDSGTIDLDRMLRKIPPQDRSI
jgi:RNA polymerase sigma-70 factor (ECF subfamily)